MSKDEENAEGVFSGCERDPLFDEAARRSLEELLAEAEPLLPELKPYVFADGDWVILHHPLVISVPYIEHLNAHYNKQFRYKKQRLRSAKSEGDWSTYINLHERPYRIEAFSDVEEYMTNGEYWSLLAEVWTDSENIRQNPEEWEYHLLSGRPSIKSMMSEEEAEELDSLPDVITLYQGHTDIRDDGWSWTTDRGIAEWFARRFAMLEKAAPMLTTAEVNKSDIHAYLTRRGEKEIIANPELVRSRNTVLLELTSAQ